MNYTITYYRNRKLYSHDASRYGDLKECKELIDSGYSVKFIEHKRIPSEFITPKGDD